MLIIFFLSARSNHNQQISVASGAGQDCKCRIGYMTRLNWLALVVSITWVRVTFVGVHGFTFCVHSVCCLGTAAGQTKTNIPDASAFLIAECLMTVALGTNDAQINVLHLPMTQNRFKSHFRFFQAGAL